MTATRWPMLPLGQVLTRFDEYVTVLEPRPYRRISVRLAGRGAVADAPSDGSAVKMQKHQLARAGQVIVSEIWAKKGAIGIVPPECDGALVTSHFFLFDVSSPLIEHGWLRWLIQSNYFERQLSAEARGTTGYASVRPHHFLAALAPLPAIDEQRRIVARLDAVSARLKTRAEAAQRQEVELAAMLRSLSATDTTPTPMRELLSLRPLDVEVRPEGQYQFSGVYSFGRGVFRAQRKSGADFAYPRLTTLRNGDFTYPKLMAWEGAYGIVPPECDGTVVSPEFPVFAVNADRVRPEVLAVHFSDPRTWERLSGASTGTNARRRRLNPGNLFAYEMPLPSPTVQNLVCDVMRKAAEVRALNAAAAEDAAALLPAMLHQMFSPAAC
jgi:type I restriction enzyme S subunit